MLLHGDELGRTQNGNNNTYAQDSELSWMRWDAADTPLMEFTATVARLRAAHPIFRRKRFFTGTAVRVGDEQRLNDIVWLHPDGRPIEDGDWAAEGGRALGMYLNGHGVPSTDETGNPITDTHALLYFNPGTEAVQVTLPADEYAPAWDVAVDTAADGAEPEPLVAGAVRELAGHSVLVLIEHVQVSLRPQSSAAASVAVLTQASAAEPE